MLRNFLKTFYRNLLSNKFSSVISVSGFVVGLSCSLLLFIALFEEYSYETMFANRDRIYRIGITSRMKDKSVEFASNVPALAPFVQQQLPEIESIARVNADFPESVIKTGVKQNMLIRNVYFADSTFFNVFPFKIISGDASVLKQPNQLILTRSVARALFGDQEAVGQSVIFANNKLLNVGAVLEDLPSNTHFKFQGLISWITLPDADIWDDAHSYTYMLIRKGTDIEQLKRKINSAVAKHPMVKSMEQRLQTETVLDYQSLANIHLYSHRYAELSDNANIDVLHVFFGIAVFLLLISIFNYVNIAIAGSLSRAKEIGVRKVLGSLNSQIRMQFLLETTILILISLGLSVILAVLFLPGFSSLVDLKLDFNVLFNPRFVLLVGLMLVLVILISSAYPAFRLSSFNPVKILSGNGSSGKGGSLSLRQVLVVLQLTISTAIITCTIFSVRQINFITKSDIGFDKDNVVVIGTPDPGRFWFFKQEMESDPDVVALAASNYGPSSPMVDEYAVEQDAGQLRTFNLRHFSIDYNFANLMKMKIVEGRNFDRSFTTDVQDAFIVNETAVKFFGWKDPIGQTITAKNNKKAGKVIGVIKNADLFSLHQQRGPLIISLTNFEHLNGESLFIKYKNKTDLRAFLKRIKENFNNAYGDIPFAYSFLDESYDHLYKSDERYRNIIFWGGCIMIFISCLGLYGLSRFVAAKRKKEVGVRKILGASVFQIVAMHMKNFLVLSLVGVLIAIPVSWYATWRWLQTFSVRIDLQIWIFIASAVIIMAIVVLTTALHAWRLSQINPGVAVRE